MRTIKTKGTVDENGKLTLHLPDDVQPGEYELTLSLIADSSEQSAVV